MKTLVLFFAVIAVTFAFPSEDDEYDNVNLDEILGNRRLLLPYIKCALDQGRCSGDGKKLKDHIREYMETDCGKCTPKRKFDSDRIVRHLIKHEKDYWEQLKAKYDPEGIYSPKTEREAARFEAEEAAKKS